MNRGISSVLIFFGIMLIGFNVLYAAEKSNKIVIEGSTTVLPIAQIAAEEYMDAYPDSNISVRGGGSGVGITSLIEGTCDIADSSRPAKKDEFEKALKKGKKLAEYVIAKDGIAVIVNPSNKIKGLTKQQVKNIYIGKISDWAELGGEKKEIVVISRDTASGTFEAFMELALDKMKVRPDALMQSSNQTIANIVSGTPGAVGYIGVGYITKKVKGIPINGKIASKDSVLSGEYPYARSLYMYTDANPKKGVKDFIDFMLSKEGQSLVEEEGFIGIQ